MAAVKYWSISSKRRSSTAGPGNRWELPKIWPSPFQNFWRATSTSSKSLPEMTLALEMLLKQKRPLQPKIPLVCLKQVYLMQCLLFIIYWLVILVKYVTFIYSCTRCPWSSSCVWHHCYLSNCYLATTSQWWRISNYWIPLGEDFRLQWSMGSYFQGAHPRDNIQCHWPGGRQYLWVQSYCWKQSWPKQA